MILSASRRTDIPAFYAKWLLNRLREKFLQVRNPFNPRHITELRFEPEHIDALVFWTKNPMPMLNQIRELDHLGYWYYFLYTINHYPEWEKKLPSLTERINSFKALSDTIGGERVIWRYDPIIFNDYYTPMVHLQQFEKLARTLSGFTTRCITSYLTPYKKTVRNLGNSIDYHPNEDSLFLFYKEMNKISISYGISLQSCSVESSVFKHMQGACIDGELISRFSHKNKFLKKDSNQRKSCMCVKSFDIGTYNTCAHHCNYCYATRDHTQAQLNRNAHDPASPLLFGSYDPSIDKIFVKRTVDTNRQVTLF